jgi:hypothetical protein
MGTPTTGPPYQTTSPPGLDCQLGLQHPPVPENTAYEVGIVPSLSSSNNEEIFLQHHRSIPNNEENLFNKSKPRKSKRRSKIGEDLDCSGSQEKTTINNKTQKTATINNNC